MNNTVFTGADLTLRGANLRWDRSTGSSSSAEIPLEHPRRSDSQGNKHDSSASGGGILSEDNPQFQQQGPAGYYYGESGVADSVPQGRTQMEPGYPGMMYPQIQRRDNNHCLEAMDHEEYENDSYKRSATLSDVVASPRMDAFDYRFQSEAGTTVESVVDAAFQQNENYRSKLAGLNHSLVWL